ncbi:acyl-CoA thioesterase [Pseudooceanicola sp.]|jgi:acyl-CoA thioester hydrolase|uniref:acyl-CoA thioesterase n=1 Tax=Pseudooceanicola sp. TaxID=1914328 RepID=UPI0040594E10
MAGTETLRAYVQPWHCDEMGHMNVRHYLGMFDDAAFVLLAMIGHMTDEAYGWADVQHTLRYLEETPQGSAVVVTSELVKLGTKSMTVLHRMSDAVSGRVQAEAETVTVYFDLKARKAAPIPEAFRAKLEAL